MLNLECSKGHLHFSPEPEKFAGRACLFPFGDPLRLDGGLRVRIERCYEPLKGGTSDEELMAFGLNPRAPPHR